tara:strand:- start:42717 stop:43271 length:555 start_codon:yes stop_codon:yes gene_type:complete
MALTVGGSSESLSFSSESVMATRYIPNNRTCHNRENGLVYSVSASDEGSGVELAGGNFANPYIAPQDPQIAVNASDILTLRGDDANNQTGTAYTMVPEDKGKTIWMNNAAANVVTIPLGLFLVNNLAMVMSEGLGTTTISADAGVSLNGVDGGSVDILGQFLGATIVKRASNTFVITGAIGEVS